ncbi:MAG: AzlD domain-containing protein [Holdemanella sp.]|nr:AzlD domain-containing protein [Holdemanella sp.]
MKPIYIYIFIMAAITYLIRMLPITLFQKEIKNQFVKSFLYYVPYAVLSAMTFPAMLSATGNPIASTASCIAALMAAYKEKSLLQVAIIACVVAYGVTLVLSVV